jgi:hypothetical protein
MEANKQSSRALQKAKQSNKSFKETNPDSVKEQTKQRKCFFLFCRVGIGFFEWLTAHKDRSWVATNRWAPFISWFPFGWLALCSQKTSWYLVIVSIASAYIFRMVHFQRWSRRSGVSLRTQSSDVHDIFPCLESAGTLQRSGVSGSYSKCELFTLKNGSRRRSRAFS